LTGNAFAGVWQAARMAGGLVADIYLYMTLADHHGTPGSAS
jgi:hypothetical protein